MDAAWADQQDAPFAACYGLQNSAKTSGFTVSANDKGTSFLCSANPGFTVALSAAATLGDGFIFAVVNSGVGTITIDPNGTEKIFFPGGGGPGGGSPTTLTLETFQSVLLTCDGTSWYVVSSVGFSGGFGGRTKVLAALATLTAADTGAAVLCGTGSYAVTLPANTTQGWSAYIANIGSGTTITVSAASATPIIINGAAGVSSFTLTTGQSSWIMNAGSGNYYVTGPYGGLGGAIANTQVAYGNGTAITGEAAFAYNSGTNVLTVDNLDLLNPLPVGEGGTGLTSLTNAITDAMLRQGAGLSVVGRSANSTGNVADIVAGSDGDILRRSGTSIGFGAIPATSVTNFTSGTFTPTIAGSTTAGTQTYAANGQVGRYQRLGNVVYVQVYVSLTALDGATAGNVLIKGLPFTPNTATNAIACFTIGQYANITLSGGKFVVFATAAGVTSISILESAFAGPPTALPVTGLSATSYFALSGTYEL